MPPRKPSPVGAHVPVTGGLASGGLTYARNVGAQAVQVFVGNPRGWALPAGDRRQDSAFRSACAEERISAFVHAAYLVNVASSSTATHQQSVASLGHCLRRGTEIGARGVVVHTGSSVTGEDRDAALARVRESLLPLLEGEGPDLLIEPTAGQGQSLCASVEDLGPYLEALGHHPRVGICLDTCHAFAAGHDLAAPGGLRRTLDRLVKVVGRGRLRLVHANDSKDPMGSARDRHERIGQGHIGESAFAELFRHPATRDVPVIIETPGKEPEHTADLALLRALRDR